MGDWWVKYVILPGAPGFIYYLEHCVGGKLGLLLCRGAPCAQSFLPSAYFFLEKQAVRLLLEAALPNNGCWGSRAAEMFGSRFTASALCRCGHRRRVMDSGEIKDPAKWH